MIEGLPGAGVKVALTVVAGCVAATGGAAAAAVALAAHSSPRGRPASQRGLDVLPFPGAPDAAAGTNIDLPAASPAQVASITAVGSRSGRHAGSLSAQPGGNGTAFSPDRPFSPGERVSVTATFSSSTAAAGLGAPRVKQISFSFSVARAGSTAGSQEPATGAIHRHTMSTSQPLTHTFITHPGFKAPIVTMTGKDTDTGAGDVFLNSDNTGQNAACILSPRGGLLWYRPATSGQRNPQVHNVRVQTYHGHPVLTYWQGGFVKPPGGGRGRDLILNDHYQTIHTVTAGNGYERQGTDLHEFVLGQEGSEATAFVSIWAPVKVNLTSVGGPPSGSAFDWIVQEIDIDTGKVIWEWHALGHVPISDSHLRYVAGQGYDYFHLNSIQQLPDGNVLISARHTWAIYLIDKATGKIIWQLGGKHSTFDMATGATFEWQHDATLYRNNVLTVFDDAAGFTKEESQSRALKLRLNTTEHRATLVHQYLHSPPTRASSQGSVQILPNGNVFVGWGSKPYFSEFTPNGTQLFSGSFVAPVASYRAYRFNWVGKPLQPPAIAVRRSATAAEDSVYASWNGATRVSSWQVLSSSSRTGRFTPIGSPVPWSDFETKIHAPRANYFEVQALNSRGDVLRTSARVAGR